MTNDPSVPKTPRQLADDLMAQAEQFSRYSGDYAGYLKVQADFFQERRADFKSDNACQKAFDASAEGVNMNIIKLKLKALEKQMSALKTMLRLLETEAHNIY